MDTIACDREILKQVILKYEHLQASHDTIWLEPVLDEIHVPQNQVPASVVHIMKECGII